MDALWLSELKRLAIDQLSGRSSRHESVSASERSPSSGILSDEDVKPALSLKYHHVEAFAEKHGVNLEWLLEGKGRMFKNSPPTLV